YLYRVLPERSPQCKMVKGQAFPTGLENPSSCRLREPQSRHLERGNLINPLIIIRFQILKDETDQSDLDNKLEVNIVKTSGLCASVSCSGHQRRDPCPEMNKGRESRSEREHKYELWNEEEH
ncbi:hypothetical protein BHM03_00046105, partial [Ensete ventricosum]